MFFFPSTWFRFLANKPARKPIRKKPQSGFRLGIEELESRLAPAIGLHHTLVAPGNQTSLVGDSVQVQVATTDTSSPPNTIQATGLPGGLSLGSNGENIVGSISTGAQNDGPYTVTISIIDYSNNVIDTESFIWTVRVTPTITWANPADITYGDALGETQLNASTGIAGTYSYSITSGTVLHAGNNQQLSVTFTPDDTAHYTTATQTVSLNVLPAQLTISAVNKNRTYGGENPSLTATYSGFVNGDTVESLSALATLSTEATSASNAGSYAITVSGASSADYSFTYEAGTLLVNKANATITVTPYSETYDGSSHTATFTVTGVNNEMLSGMDVSATTHTNPGTFSDDTWAFTDVTGNYNNATGAVNNTIGVEISSPGDQENFEGASIELFLSYSNPVGESITFSAEGLPNGLFIDETGVIQGMIDEGTEESSPYLVTVTATYEIAALTATQTFTWNVDANPITLYSLSDQESTAGTSINLAISSFNSLGNPVTFLAISLPNGLTMDQDTGEISGIIDQNISASASFLVSIIASDVIANATQTQTFIWTITSTAIAPVAADFGPVNVCENGSVAINMTQVAMMATNLGDGDISYEIIAYPVSGTLISQSDGTVLYEPNQNWTGTDSFTYRFVTANGESNVATVTLEVSDASILANDVYFMSESGTAYTFTPADLIANASTSSACSILLTTINGAPATSDLQLTLFSGATITGQPDGSFIYQSTVGAIGTDQFAFTMSANNIIVVATVNMLLGQGPIRLGQPLAQNVTLRDVLTDNFNGWSGQNGISLQEVNQLIQSRTLTVDQAAAVAVMKAFIVQSPANLQQIGAFGDLFQVAAGTQAITAPGLINYRVAFNNNDARARQLETMFQDMRTRLAVDVTSSSLFPTTTPADQVYTTVRQGYVGDCAFLASVIAYTRQGGFPNIRGRIVPAGDQNGVPTYDVTLFNGVGQPTNPPIRVTEPTYAERALYAGTTDGSRWLSILEKAYVSQWALGAVQQQVLNNRSLYDVAANGENMANALIRVTGLNAQQVSNNYPLPNVNFVNAVLSVSSNNRVVLAQSRTAAELQALPDSMAGLRTIPATHAYAIVGFSPLGVGNGVVTLRNPWNIDGTYGREFQLTLQEFLRAFDGVSVQALQ